MCGGADLASRMVALDGANAQHLLLQPAPDPAQCPARFLDRGAPLVHVPVDLCGQCVKLGDGMAAALDF